MILQMKKYTLEVVVFRFPFFFFGDENVLTKVWFGLAKYIGSNSSSTPYRR